MGFESTARAWAHQHGLQNSRVAVAAYRGMSRIRFRNAWDGDVDFRGHRFRIGQDMTLFPAVHSGGFEAEELDTILPLVRSDSVVWDVGANIGIYAVLLAAAAPRGHVEAFEPVPASHERLLHNIAANDLSNVTVHNVALSDRAGTAQMAVHADAHGCDQIGEVEEGAEALDVATMTGDEFLATSASGDPDLVKVDIEGHEPAFLDGAWAMFTRRRPVLMMEVNPLSWHGDEQVRRWQETLDRLFGLYGSGTWFDAGQPTEVRSLAADSLDSRAYTLLLGAGSN